MKKDFVVSTREKISYGMGDLGNNVAYGSIGFYFVFFLTDVAGMSPVWAGYIFMVCRMWNALSDLFVGVLSDRTRTRFGRRRPYLLFGAVPLGISFALLWIVPFHGNTYLIIYYSLIGVLFNTMYSLVALPYNSLLPELSQNYDERTSIAGYKMGLSFVGSLLSAMGVMLIVDTVYPGKSMYAESFPVMGRILALFIIINILIAFFGTKERVSTESAGHGGGIAAGLRSLFKLREFRLVTGVFIFNMIGFDVITAMYIYYLKYAMKISDDVSFVFMAIPLVIAVAATPLWVRVSEGFGKQKAYILSAAYFLVPLFLCLIIPSGNIPFILTVTVLMGVGISASQVLTYSILPDVVEVDELKNGIRREGAIYGMTMFLYKISSAVSIAAVTAAMGLFGYVESAGGVEVVQTASAVMGIRILISCAPALCFVVSAIFVKRLPLDRQSFETLKQSISDKNS
jgi:GPH family glycoside/pentoside/hexuronide:cation symporter